MAKIIGICGSPRTGATEYSLKRALAAAESVPGIETELILFKDKNIHRCVHCNRCAESEIPLPNYCIFDDDMKSILDRFVTADGIILASPVYGMNISGLLKDFLDRFRSYIFESIHRKQNAFVNMPLVGSGIAVGGTRNGGQEETLSAIINFFLTYEIMVTGGPGGNYLGAAVWSRDRKAEGAEEDTVGMGRVDGLGKRIAELALVLQAGRETLAEKGVTPSWMEGPWRPGE
ncbi:MAG: flavodoxin family protein [Candidatus Auribacterota bacterium]|nr:flavodoxin family protein [Candidatus Auribacterota bacterium]